MIKIQSWIIANGLITVNKLLKKNVKKKSNILELGLVQVNQQVYF